MANPDKPDQAQNRTPRFDAGDEERVGERKRDNVAREARKMQALGKMLGDPAGREYLWDLMGDCYIFHNTFTGNAEGYFREGKRNIGLKVLADIMKNHPESFYTMMRENSK